MAKSGRRNRQAADYRRDAGFVAVDALVGLTLLTAALTLAIVASQTALTLSRKAAQLQRARSTLLMLAETTPVVVGERSGQAFDFTWSSNVSRTDGQPLCQLQVRVAPLSGKGHYDLRTLKPCKAVNAGEG